MIVSVALLSYVMSPGNVKSRVNQGSQISAKLLWTVPDYLIGLLLVTSATLAWSTAGLFTRAIALDNWTLLVWRGVFGAMAIALITGITYRSNTLKQFTSMSPAGWLFVVVSGIGMVMFITALNHTTVAHVSILYATVPLVTAFIAWLVLREKPTKHSLIASLFSILGVCIMMGLSGEGHWTGNLLALGMTISLAAMMIISRSNPDIPILPAACLSALLSAALALPFSSPLSVEPEQWIMLFLFGVVNSALGLVLFTIGAKYLPAIETALITALDAPLAPVLVWILFNETPGFITMFGGSIVFIAVAVYLATAPRQQS